MSLVACQPGWVAVFIDPHDDTKYDTEPVACWRLVEDEVRPICTLAGEVCDATLALNFIGVVGPEGVVEKLVRSYLDCQREAAKARAELLLNDIEGLKC